MRVLGVLSVAAMALACCRGGKPSEFDERFRDDVFDLRPISVLPTASPPIGVTEQELVAQWGPASLRYTFLHPRRKMLDHSIEFSTIVAYVLIKRDETESETPDFKLRRTVLREQITVTFFLLGGSVQDYCVQHLIVGKSAADNRRGEKEPCAIDLQDSWPQEREDLRVYWQQRTDCKKLVTNVTNCP